MDAPSLDLSCGHGSLGRSAIAISCIRPRIHSEPRPARRAAGEQRSRSPFATTRFWSAAPEDAPVVPDLVDAERPRPRRRRALLPRRSRRRSRASRFRFPRRAGARRMALRRPALAVLPAAGAAARDRRPCVSSGRNGTALIATAADAERRRGPRPASARRVPGVRLRRLPARDAGDDGARHARPRAAPGARAALSARHVQRACGLRRGRERRSRTASAARCARRWASRSAASATSPASRGRSRIR